jgi:hypothetical protein
VCDPNGAARAVKGDSQLGTKLVLEHGLDDLEEIGPIMWDARALATLWGHALTEMARTQGAGHSRTYLMRIEKERARLATIASRPMSL